MRTETEVMEDAAVYGLCTAALIYLAAQIIRANGGIMRYVEVAGYCVGQALAWICELCSQHSRPVLIFALCLVMLLLMWINNAANKQFKETVTRIPEDE